MAKIGRGVDRRQFLKVTGGLTATGLVAGCTGDGGDGGSDGGDGGSDGGDGGSDGGDGDTDYPQQTVTLLIPYGPGGGYDTYTRLVAPYVEEELGETVQPQNREGAGGVIATEETYNADPDGYTLQIANVSDFAINQIQEDVDYDLTEMTWLAQIAEDLRGIGVAAHTEITTFDEYVEAVQNEELKFYAPGPGSGQVIVPAVLGEVADLYPAENVTDNVVTYDGRSEAYQGMLGGDVDVMAGTYNSILPFAEEDQEDPVEMILALNVDEEPPEQTPDADTLATAGVDNAEEIQDTVTGRRAFAGPPDLPDDVTGVLVDAFEAAIADDEFLQEAEEAERPVSYLGPEDTARAVQNMIEPWENNPDLLDAVFY